MQQAETIFVALVDEGTDCWRPVRAERLGDGLYRIVGKTPTDEIWAFATGDIVKCELQVFQDGSSRMVAYEKSL